MDNKLPTDNILSPEASRSRAEYYRRYRAKNRSGDKAIKLRYWEKKAQEFYKEEYVGPKPGESLSSQAREVRRKYYAEYRKNNQETITRAYTSYWERKAKEIIS